MCRATSRNNKQQTTGFIVVAQSLHLLAAWRHGSPPSHDKRVLYVERLLDVRNTHRLREDGGRHEQHEADAQHGVLLSFRDAEVITRRLKRRWSVGAGGGVSSAGGASRVPVDQQTVRVSRARLLSRARWLGAARLDARYIPDSPPALLQSASSCDVGLRSPYRSVIYGKSRHVQQVGTAPFSPEPNARVT